LRDGRQDRLTLGEHRWSDRFRRGAPFLHRGWFGALRRASVGGWIRPQWQAPGDGRRRRRSVHEAHQNLARGFLLASSCLAALGHISFRRSLPVSRARASSSAATRLHAASLAGSRCTHVPTPSTASLLLRETLPTRTPSPSFPR